MDYYTDTDDEYEPNNEQKLAQENYDFGVKMDRANAIFTAQSRVKKYVQTNGLKLPTNISFETIEKISYM